MASAGQTFIVQVLGFAVLVGVIVKLALPQLGKILGARTSGIEQTFTKIDQDTKAVTARLAELKEKLAHLNEESRRRLDAALADAEKTKAQLMADANAQVQAAFAKSKNEIQIERDKAILELRHEATSLTLQAADHLVQSTMSEPIHGKMVDKYLHQLDAVRKS
jgi:F-type H+-transporting ATPase subunit b